MTAVSQQLPLIPTKAGFSVVGLFAGIGGLELGLQRAGHHAAFLCEIMEPARAALHAHFSHAMLHDDVLSTDFSRRLPEQFDILTAGFPCQDLSQAGRVRGIDGARSGLILRVFEVLASRPPSRRPRWIIFENVAFMRHLEGGRAMRIVLDHLTTIGYAWAYREVDSNAFGLPQRRKRVYFVACKFGEGDPRRVLLADDAGRPVTPRGPAWLQGTACGFYWTEGNRGLGWAHDAVPAIKGGSTLQIPSPPAVLHPDEGLVLPSIEDAEELQGFPAGWTESAVGRGDDRYGRKRWLLVGNAVSVPVAQWLGTRLLRPCADEPGVRHVEVLHPSSPWPRAAYRLSEDGPVHAAAVSDWPLSGADLADLGLRRTSLRALMDARSHMTRMPLSRKATEGFLARFERSRLLINSDPDLRAALIEHLTLHLRAKAS